MPEFEEIKTNPDLHKESHQYQPSKDKAPQEGQKETNAPSSNMRGRWKRPSRGAPKAPSKDQNQGNRPSLIKEAQPLSQKEEPSEFEDYEEYEQDFDKEDIEETEPTNEVAEEPVARTHHPRKHRERRDHRENRDEKPAREEKTFKPTSRKDVFIPKTRQDLDRHKSRLTSSGAKKPSLWKRILAFLGLAAPVKKHSERKSHSRYEDSRGPRTSSRDGRRPQQRRRHSVHGQQRHRSDSSHKRDQKSND